METCMMEEKDLNPKIWDESIKYYAYVQNISPHKYLDLKTLYEAWIGHKPNVSHFMVFGSKAWARIPPEKRKSLQPQRKESIMVGYVEYSNVYNLFDPSSQNIHSIFSNNVASKCTIWCPTHHNIMVLQSART